jgi:hypothetical protein
MPPGISIQRVLIVAAAVLVGMWANSAINRTMGRA